MLIMKKRTIVALAVMLGILVCCAAALASSVSVEAGGAEISVGETVVFRYQVENPEANGRTVYRIEAEGANGMQRIEYDYLASGSEKHEDTVQYTLTDPYVRKIHMTVRHLVGESEICSGEAEAANRQPKEMKLAFEVADPNAQYQPGDVCTFTSAVAGTKDFGNATIRWVAQMVNYNGNRENEKGWISRQIGDRTMTDVPSGNQKYMLPIPEDARNDETIRTTFTFTCGGWTKTVVKESAVTGGSTVDLEKIKAFVRRCYAVILGREVDEEGLTGWSAALAQGTAYASEIINGIVNSREYQLKKLGNEACVQILYRAMLDREADAGGLAAWTKVLDEGYPLGSVINGFCGSAEFVGICNEYGIEPGYVDVGEVAPKPTEEDTPKPDGAGAATEQIQAYVSRCYSVILGRSADQGGLQGWSEALANGTAQPSQIIEGFVNSPEFLAKGLNKEGQVETLYQAMLGRSADAEGLAGWVQALDSGMRLEDIINGFANSAEFKTIVNGMK